MVGGDTVPRRARFAAAHDRGAGSALVIGIVAVVCVAGLTMLGGGHALARGQLLTSAADAAALAAADVMLGWAPGDPCAVAERVATAHSVRLSACAAEGLSMVVRVEASILGLTISRSALAGPPEALR